MNNPHPSVQRHFFPSRTLIVITHTHRDHPDALLLAAYTTMHSPAFAPPTAHRTSLAAASARPALCASQAPAVPATRTVRMAIPYAPTGSGYGGSGIPYANDRFGQGFKATTASDIVSTCAAVPVFKTLLSLLRETGLDYELSKGGPFTVFAPTDDAFAALLNPHGFKVLGGLMRPENRAEVKALLAHHVVQGRVPASAVFAAGRISATTLSGDVLPVSGYNKKLSAGSAAVVKSDVLCSNGVIHVINSVLVPPSFAEQPTGPVTKKFFSSVVLDIVKNSPTPRQALGIDAYPVSGGLLK
jgi:uncharacterized surface protein with fasciclin (FAS1) repeats